MATIADQARLPSLTDPDLELKRTPTGTAADADLVDWEGDDDPAKPTNWSSKKKWTNGGLLAAMTLITYEALNSCEF